MELLLNLVWIALAIGLFVIFWRRERSTARPGVSRYLPMMALACALLLLFPVISASDDLHPAQALMEDATRRVLHLASLQHSPAGSSMPYSLPVALLGLLFALTRWQPVINLESKVRVLDGFSSCRECRGPPACCR